ncbi:MAG: hypothetical protein ACE5DS_02300 [Kiloniellaceae bacterium]
MRALAKFVTGRTTDLQAGDVGIAEDGAPRPRGDDVPPIFAFAYRGARFVARIDSTPNARTVYLSADLGKLPYSLEVGAGRRTARTIIALSHGLPRGRLSLTDDHDIHLDAKAAAPEPVTPASVMATVVALLLDFKSHLDLLRDALSAPAPQARSKAKPATAGGGSHSRAGAPSACGTVKI